jgi:hypothetical protein
LRSQPRIRPGLSSGMAPALPRRAGRTRFGFSRTLIPLPLRPPLAGCAAETFRGCPNLLDERIGDDALIEGLGYCRSPSAMHRGHPLFIGKLRSGPSAAYHSARKSRAIPTAWFLVCFSKAGSSTHPSHLTRASDTIGIEKINWKRLLSTTRTRQLAGGKSSENPVAKWRSGFERDYDRAVFSTAVRRLQNKAQVYPLEQNDSDCCL